MTVTQAVAAEQAAVAERVVVPLRGRIRATPELVGRDLDLTVIREFVTELPAYGGTLLLTGEPGVGKTALLHAAAELAATAGIRVLRAAGAECEDESFSGLNQLLLPLRDELGRLDDLHRNTLEAALGFGDGPARDRLVVASAVLALLSGVAADGPLLLIVDNLPWMDQASVWVLGFVARRLSGRWVGLLGAERSGRPAGFDPDLPRHEVPPLDEVSSARLVSVRWPDVAPGVRRRIVAQAQGNALALVELPLALTDQQRAGRVALPAILPLSPRLRASWSPLVAALPAASRDLMLLAVLEATASLPLLRAAAADASAAAASDASASAAGQHDFDDLAPAEHAGLVHVDETAGLLTFAHPLIRSAVLDLSASHHVRRAHRALAAQLHDQPERQAWHLAGAATGPDAAVAGQLEQSARRVRDSGRAVTALLRAAQLSPRDRTQGRLWAEAAYLSATVTGELPLAARLLADARAASGSQGSLHTAVTDASLQLNAGADIETVHRLLATAVEAAPQDGGPALVGALHQLLTVCAAGGRPELWAPFHTALARLEPGDRTELDLLAYMHTGPAREAIAILPQLDAALAGLPRGAGDHRRTLILAAAAARTDRLAGCREALRQVTLDGAALPAIDALTLLCHDGFTTGAWDEATRLGREALHACQSYGQPARAWLARAHLATIAAARGDDELVGELTGELLRWAMPRGVTSARLAAHAAGSLAACGRGDFAEAYREATAINQPGTLDPSHGHSTMLDLVESAVRTGRQADADVHVAAARAARIAEISPRLDLLVTASAALAAPDDQGRELFEQALAIPGASRWPFEYARVQLAYGEHLRRIRATSEARVPLGAALATFRALGAHPWTERAAHELRVGTLTVVRTDVFRTPVLTTQERHIAALAAAGLTNKQIGQRLYLSPRTVSAYLYKIFPKLGISRRAGLRDALVALGPGDGELQATA